MTVLVNGLIMPEFDNPYQPGEPIADRERFFGRRDILGSMRENLVRGRRVQLVAGARRMGKTSLLLQLSGEVPDGFVGVPVALSEETTRRLDWLLWRIADSIAAQLRARLGVELPEPAWSAFDGKPDTFLESWWPGVSPGLGGRIVVLMLDDIDCLEQGAPALVAELSSFLARWRDRDAGWALVVTSSRHYQEKLLRERALLFGGATSYLLGPLSGEDATRLVTWPVDGVLTYDYGVPRRLIEIASGHPYFLQLLCHEVFNRCARAGWVNQRDVDLVLEGLIRREAPEFRQMWDESTAEERAVLAALVSMRGARGVATVQEVQTALSRAGGRVRRDQVELILERLESREVLERLGALSYRFRVALLRDWLGERVDLADVARDARWSRARGDPGRHGRAIGWADLSPAAADHRGTAGDVDAEPSAGSGERSSHRRGWMWVGLAAVLLVAVVAVAGYALLKPDRGWGSITPMATPTSIAALSSPAGTRSVSTRGTVTVSEVTTGTSTRIVSPTGRPAQTALSSPAPPPSPTISPSPSAPVVVSRPVPSIAYLSRKAPGGGWSLWLMNSDGTSRSPLQAAGADFLSAPSWSPDGTRLAFVSDQSGNADIWVVGVDGAGLVNLTNDEAKDHSPAWSPDGEWIAFASVRDVVYWEIYAMRPDGTDVQRVTWWDDASDLSPSWSPDGGRLAFASKRDGDWEIYAVDLDGSNLVRLTENPADDTSPAWSPDGSRIAFESNRAGFTDIYVMAAIGGAATNLTNLAWATDLGPTWSPDGGRLAFFSDRDGEWDIYVMASDGSDAILLTGAESVDQLPSWRP